MLKRVVTVLSLLVILSLGVFSQQNTIVLVHPTEYNLKLITYLKSNNLIDIEGLKITGVYHRKENYDYSISRKFLEGGNFPYIQLIEVAEDINENNIFSTNPCTGTFEKLVDESCGALFMGGPDIPPSVYGEKTSLLTEITDNYRHYFEVSFLCHLLGSAKNDELKPLLEKKKAYVVYAICLGMQSMNVATGGDLYQDIPQEIYQLNSAEDVLGLNKDLRHRNYYNNLMADSTLFPGNFHAISLLDFRPFTGEYKPLDEVVVYSNHHQSVHNLGKGLRVIATSGDGKVVEAIAHGQFKNVLGIQFHPEGTYLYQNEVKYKEVPHIGPVAAKQILTDRFSFLFHVEFWKTFSDKIKQAR